MYTYVAFVCVCGWLVGCVCVLVFIKALFWVVRKLFNMTDSLFVQQLVS